MKPLLLLLLVFTTLGTTHADTTSGLAIPRFVALKSSETNLRTGPGTRYPIQWVFRREGMPVEVIEEFELWRKVRDADGTAGWVHKTMITGKRNVMVKGKQSQIVRSEPEAKAKPLLKVEPAVVMRLVECNPDWCRIQVSGRKGWIEKKYLWGIYKEEVFD